MTSHWPIMSTAHGTHVVASCVTSEDTTPRRIETRMYRRPLTLGRGLGYHFRSMKTGASATVMALAVIFAGCGDSDLDVIIATTPTATATPSPSPTPTHDTPTVHAAYVVLGQSP